MVEHEQLFDDEDKISYKIVNKNMIFYPLPIERRQLSERIGGL